MLQCPTCKWKFTPAEMAKHSHLAMPFYAAVTKVDVHAMTPMAAHVLRRLTIAQGD